MFSSPLVREQSGRIENGLQIDYLSEIDQIEKSLSGLNQQINYKVNIAT
jgi:hypothetical protein